MLVPEPLDRSGKPCRKWARGSFTLKSFTGVHLGGQALDGASEDPSRRRKLQRNLRPASAEGGSSKENKENNSQVKSEISNKRRRCPRMQSAARASLPPIHRPYQCPSLPHHEPDCRQHLTKSTEVLRTHVG